MAPKVEEEKPKQNIDIFDLACEPSPPQPPQPKNEPIDLINMTGDTSSSAPPAPSANVFDLLGQPQNNQPAEVAMSPNMNLMENNYLGAPSQVPQQPQQHKQPVISMESNMNFQTGASQPFQSNVLGNISLANNYTTENVLIGPI